MMDTSKILRPYELPFKVSEQLANDINALIAALERNDTMNLDCYLDEVQGSARDVSEENDAWIRNYYVRYGWRNDKCNI